MFPNNSIMSRWSEISISRPLFVNCKLMISWSLYWAISSGDFPTVKDVGGAKIAYSGTRTARMCHNVWVQKVIKQQEINQVRTNLHVRLLHRKMCHLLSWLKRRVSSSTSGGVRGRLLFDCVVLLYVIPIFNILYEIIRLYLFLWYTKKDSLSASGCSRKKYETRKW